MNTYSSNQSWTGVVSAFSAFLIWGFSPIIWIALALFSMDAVITWRKIAG